MHHDFLLAASLWAERMSRARTPQGNIGSEGAPASRCGQIFHSLFKVKQSTDNNTPRGGPTLPVDVLRYFVISR